VPEYDISQGELDSLTDKLDRFSESLTDSERAALLHVFDLASDDDVEGFSMGALGGGSIFGPPVRTLFVYDKCPPTPPPKPGKTKTYDFSTGSVEGDLTSPNAQ
jgi:hypothetical protein